MVFDGITEATVRIAYDGFPDSTGFRFVDDELIITNAHVLEPTIKYDLTPTAVTTTGTDIELELLDYSPEPESGGHDYAILEAKDPFPSECSVLQPDSDTPTRGDEVCFAGFPFEATDILVHTALVSGPHEYGFHLDGTINSGNSGGPIVNRESGDVVGMATQRKFAQARELTAISDDLYQVEKQLKEIESVRNTKISGIEIEDMAIDCVEMVQDAIEILNENANSGIGIGYDIKYVLDALEEEGYR